MRVPHVLYIADPSSIHDQKWMMPPARCERFLLMRRLHFSQWCPDQLAEWASRNRATVLGPIDDFSVARVWQTFGQLWRLLRIVRSYEIDLIHIMFAEPNVLWSVFRGILGVPILVTTRGTDVLVTIPRFFLSGSPLSRIVALLYRIAFWNVDLITSTSSSQLESLCRISRGLEQKTKLIRTGIDIHPQLMPPDSELLDRIREKPFVLFPRLMRPIYQHEFAISAISLLPNKVRSDYGFVFLGRNGQDRDYVEVIENLLEKSGFNYLFLDELDQSTLRCAIEAASAVVMTPKSDGSAVTAAEALVCRTPLILPPLKYDRELFERGSFVFVEWTPECLALKIQEVLNGEWTEKLEQGRSDVVRYFDREKEMTRVWQLYQELLGTV